MTRQDNQSASPRHSRRKQIALLIVTLSFSFIVVELAFRIVFSFLVGPSVLLFGIEAPTYGFKHPEPIHEGRYFKYQPHQTRFDRDPETGERFEVTINGTGFRGRDFSSEKRPNTLRIVTLGASSTFGFSNRDDETYPVYLEHLLNQRVQDHVVFEVMNFGVPHQRSDEILSLFMAEVLPLNPDIVTLYAGMNDSKYGTYAYGRRTSIERREKENVRGRLRQVAVLRQIYRAIRDRLLVVNYLDKVILPARMGLYSTAGLHRHMEGKVEAFAQNVAGLNEECRKRGIVLIVANQQAKSLSIKRSNIKGVSYQEEVERAEEKLAEQGTLTSKEQGTLTSKEVFFLTHSKLMWELKSWASSNDVPFVNIIEALDGDRSVLVSWVHLSPKGNQIIAEELAEAILSSEVVQRARGTVQ